MTALKTMEVAALQFAEKGYDSTTMTSISKEVGIKKASLYAHYTSKEDLFHAVLDQERKLFRICWMNTLANSAHKPVELQLKLLFTTMFQHFTKNKVRAFLIRLGIFPPEGISISHELLDVHNELNEEVTTLFQRGIDIELFRGESGEDLAQAFFCLLNGCLLRALCTNEFEREADISYVWETFYHGISKTGEM